MVSDGESIPFGMCFMHSGLPKVCRVVAVGAMGAGKLKRFFLCFVFTLCYLCMVKTSENITGD